MITKWLDQSCDKVEIPSLLFGLDNKKHALVDASPDVRWGFRSTKLVSYQA